jgi:hypothetical protein
MSYILTKQKPHSEPYLTFYYSSCNLLVLIIILYLYIWAGSKLKSWLVGLHTIFSEYGFSTSPIINLAIGIIAVLLIMLLLGLSLYASIKHPFSSKAMIFYREGLWTQIGLVPWKSVLAVDVRISSAYVIGPKSTAISYFLNFERPSNLNDLNFIRRYFLNRSDKPLRFQLGFVSLLGKEKGKDVVWNPGKLRSYIMACAASGDNIAKLIGFLEHPENFHDLQTG